MARDFAAEGRAAKAMALAVVLAETSAVDDPECVLALQPVGWELAMRGAGVKRPPSDATKHAVVAALREIRRHDQAPVEDVDALFAPFAGSDQR